MPQAKTTILSLFFFILSPLDFLCLLFAMVLPAFYWNTFVDDHAIKVSLFPYLFTVCDPLNTLLSTPLPQRPLMFSLNAR